MGEGVAVGFCVGVAVGFCVGIAVGVGIGRGVGVGVGVMIPIIKAPVVNTRVMWENSCCIHVPIEDSSISGNHAEYKINPITIVS